MAMTKTLKAANTELTRLTNTILQLQKSSDKKETDEEALHLKLAHAHVLAAALFQVIGTKGKKRKEEDEEEEKEHDEAEREDKESDEDEREDKESDDDDQEEKRFQQIMARAKARLR